MKKAILLTNKEKAKNVKYEEGNPFGNPFGKEKARCKI